MKEACRQHARALPTCRADGQDGCKSWALLEGCPGSATSNASDEADRSTTPTSRSDLATTRLRDMRTSRAFSRSRRTSLHFNTSCAARSFSALAAAAFLSSPVGPSMKRPWQKRRNSILLVRRRWRRKLVRELLDVPTATRRHRNFRRRRYPPWSTSTWATGAT